MNSSRRRHLLAGLVLAPFLAGCLEKTPLDPALYEHMDVVQDSVVLDARVELFDELPLPVLAEGLASEGAGLAGVAGGAAPPSVDLRLLARIRPPRVGGVRLQASHVVRSGNRAYVAYNVRGDDFRGGVEVFDRIGSGTPRLKAQARFWDTDVSALDVSGNRIYLATATNDPTYPNPAVLEVLRVQGWDLGTERRVPLKSFAGTGVRVSGGRIYATTGSSGGLFVFDGGLNLQSSDSYGDARAVDVAGNYIVVLRGTPGALRVYNRSSGQWIRDIPLGGASIRNSKSSLFIAGDLAFAAVGDGGVVVADLRTGSVLERLARPPSSVPAHLNVSNGLTWHEDLLFVANGEAGIWVARAKQSLDKLSGAPGLEYVGRVDLTGSANFVAMRGDRLFAATGLGGLHIINVKGL